MQPLNLKNKQHSKNNSNLVYNNKKDDGISTIALLYAHEISQYDIAKIK